MGLDEDIRREAAAFKTLATEFKTRAQGPDGKTRIHVGESDEERAKILAILQALNAFLSYKMPEVEVPGGAAGRPGAGGDAGAGTRGEPTAE